MMNWEDLRYFQAIAAAGTLSGAARTLGVDNATVGRRLASLEDTLKIRLVERLPREARLTAVGQSVLEQVVAIEASALAIERITLAARSQEHGKVMIPPRRFWRATFSHQGCANWRSAIRWCSSRSPAKRRSCRCPASTPISLYA